MLNEYIQLLQDTRAFPSFRGLGSTLFTSSTFQHNMPLASMNIQPGFGRLLVQNSQNVADQNRKNKNTSFLQVDATATQPTHGHHNTDAIHRNGRQLHNQSQETHTQIWEKSDNLGTSLTISRNRKPKLHKPFHFQQPLSIDPSTGVYRTVPKTAPAGTTRKIGRGTNKNPSTRNSKRDGENSVCKVRFIDGTVSYTDIYKHTHTHRIPCLQDHKLFLTAIRLRLSLTFCLTQIQLARILQVALTTQLSSCHHLPICNNHSACCMHDCTPVQYAIHVQLL